MTEEKQLAKRKPISVVTPTVGAPAHPRASQSTVITRAIPSPTPAPGVLRPSTRIMPILPPGRLPGSPAVGAAQIRKNPAQAGIPARGTTAPRTTSVTARQTQWRCSRCAIPLAREAVVAGEAELNDGILVCSSCANKEKLAQRRVQNRRRNVAISVAVVLVSLVILPPLGLMFVLVASLSLIGIGLWGEAAKQRRQTGLVIAGLVLSVASLAGLQGWITYHAQVRAGAESNAELTEIAALLRSGKYGEAQNHNLKLQARLAESVKNGSGIGGAESALSESQKRVDTWILENFGQLSSDDMRSADALLRQLNSTDGSARLAAIGTVDGVLHVRVLATEAEPEHAQIAAELQQVASLVLTSCPGVQNVEITLLAGSRANSRPVGSATAGRAQAFAIAGESDPSAALRLPPGPPIPANPIPDGRRIRP